MDALEKGLHPLRAAVEPARAPRGPQRLHGGRRAAHDLAYAAADQFRKRYTKHAQVLVVPKRLDVLLAEPCDDRAKPAGSFERPRLGHFQDLHARRKLGLLDLLEERLDASGAVLPVSAEEGEPPMVRIVFVTIAQGVLEITDNLPRT